MRGWDEPITIENFENVLKAVHPTIEFFCNTNHERFKDYDWDDIYQLLSIKLWEIIRDEKIPKDMRICDYRFRRYLQTTFTFELGMQYRRKVSRTGFQQKVHTYRDTADLSLPLSYWEIEGSSEHIRVLEIRV